MSQPVSQSASQPASQSVSQSVSQLTQSVSQSACLSVSQSADAVSVSQDLSSSLPGSWITHVLVSGGTFWHPGAAFLGSGRPWGHPAAHVRVQMYFSNFFVSVGFLLEPIWRLFC